MVRTIFKAKIARVNRAATSAPSDASAYCRDLDNWPRSWMGLEKDLPPGKNWLLACAHSLNIWPHFQTDPKTAKTAKHGRKW
jgi:hypothetical protein